MSFEVEPDGVHCTDLSNFKKNNDWEKVRDTIKEKGITRLRITNKKNLTEIPHGFLMMCSTLQSLDLSQLVNVTSIGNQFLMNCSSLISLDLAPLANVTKIGSVLLKDCTGLTRVTAPASWKEISNHGTPGLTLQNNVQSIITYV